MGVCLDRMPLILSKHIASEMSGRGILLSYIELAISEPALQVADPVDPTLTRSYRRIAEFGNRTLRVVHRPHAADIFIVTAHWDRGMQL